MNIELLTKIAEWLETGALETPNTPALNLNLFYDDDSATDYLGHNCGTTMCIGGAAIYFVHGGFDASSEVYKEAKRLLGLNEEQAIGLFYAGIKRGNSRPEEAARAARTVRHLIATGEVNWNLA